MIRDIRDDLSGKDLICFCAPKACHGDTLIRIANAPKSINAFVDEYLFLSNFYPCEIRTKSGIVYPSSEHLYMAQKTLDKNTRKYIATLATPAKAKYVGRTIQLRPDWERIKRRVMLNVVRAKFAQNQHLQMLLLDTLDAELIEGNWWGDCLWGVCKGVGTNWLGKILMRVRQELRDQLL